RKGYGRLAFQASSLRPIRWVGCQLRKGVNVKKSTQVSTLLLTIALIVSGCATAYQSMAFSGGYAETQLDENVFEVRFKGNASTSRERVSDFCLLRCAELCKLSGYDYFIIVEGQEYTENSQYTTPTSTTTKGRARVIGNSVYGSSTSTTTGGRTYNISKPRSENTIVCFKDKPDGFSYNADFICKSITQKYGIVR
ncbi:MAG: hypothetical protein KAV87_58910, partial [Desulfobacteraceae bacterium]|nr:hypothetical protein [Desulfobacteraceae bacterium]